MLQVNGNIQSMVTRQICSMHLNQAVCAASAFLQTPFKSMGLIYTADVFATETYHV